MRWNTPRAVRQSFSELGLDPDEISWFDIKTVTVDNASEFEIEFREGRRCALVLHENLEAAWLVGFVRRPIGASSVRYHRFEPTELTESKSELRETLDRVNALDPESPRSTADALSKSDLNDRFSNIVSELYKESKREINAIYSFSDRKTKYFANSLLLTALRAKVLAEHPVQPIESFRQSFFNQLNSFSSTNESQNTPETLQPLYAAVISNGQRSLKVTPDVSAQRELLNTLVKKFENQLDKFDWILSDTAWNQLDQVTAHTIGIALERHLTLKQSEGYDTPPDLTCPAADEAIEDAIINQLQVSVDETYTDLSEILGTSINSITNEQSAKTDCSTLDQGTIEILYTDILPKLRIADPATGSGTFLLSALDTIVKLRKYIESISDVFRSFEAYDYPAQLDNQTHQGLTAWTSISQNLFGVDINPEAVAYTRFRLELAYLCTINNQDKFYPPRVGHNIKQGNSIIGKPFSTDPPYWSGQLPLTAFRDEEEPYSDLLQGIDSSDALANEVKPVLASYRSAPSAERQALLNTVIETISDHVEEINPRLRFEIYGGFEENSESETNVKEELTKKDAFHWPLEFPCVMDEGGFDAVLFHSPWLNSNVRESFDKSTRDYLYSGSQYQLPPPKGWRRTGDIIDAFFLHRAHDIVSNGGTIAALVDESVLTTSASHHVRVRYLNTTDIDRIATFTNQNTFGQIDRRFKYAIIVTQAREDTGKINIGSGFVTPENYTDIEKYYEIDTEFINRFSPKTLAFPQIEHDVQLKALDRILDAPILSNDEKSDGWTIFPTGEFNQTTDNEYISELRFEDSSPIYRGSNIYQYIYQTAPEASVDEPDLWTIPREAEQGISTREYLRERKQTSGSGSLSAESSRIVYRRITSSANERSMIASLLPPNHFHINTLNSIDPHQGDQTNIKQRLVLLGLLNSVPYDYLLRQKITNSVPKYTLFETRVPFITEDHPLFDPILRRVSRLNLTGAPFEAQREALNIQPATESEERRRKLRAEIDAAAFSLYGFQDHEVIKQVLNDFGFVRSPRVIDSDYHDLILDVLQGGEYRDVS